MIRISLTSLWARKRRMASTAVAVILGVAFLTGTLVLGDTLSANFDRLFAEVSAGTDVVVRSDTVIETDRGADDARGPLDESLVAKVAGVDGVAAAEGQVVGYGALVSRDGDPVGGNGPPRLAGSWITDPDLNPYKLVEGRAPERSDEVVVNRGAAKLGHLQLGDTTTVQSLAPVEVKIVGIATFGDQDGLGTTTWTAFTLEGAQEHVIGQPDRVNTIVARGESGVSSDELRDRVTAALPDGTEAITGADLAGERADEISATFLNMLRTFLVVFAGIALVVATLSISNTFTITVAQRTRELALLRAVGASRRQVRRSVTIEAFGLGLVAALIGVGAGLAVAGLLKGMFDAFGFALPAGGLEIRPASLIVGLVVGVVATVVAAQAAARRAAKLAPVEALRDSSTEARSISRRRLVVGAALMVVGFAANLVGALGGILLAVGVGAAALVVGTLVCAPVALSPVAGAVGGGLRRLRGVNGMMAEQNARRNPRRSASTATALVVGVAVVSLFTVFAASMKASLSDQVSSDFGADLAMTTPAFGGGQLAATAADDVAELPEVSAAVGLGGGSVLLNGDDTTVTATDPAGLADVAGIETVDGSLKSVGTDGIAVGESKADDNGWHVGSTVELTFVDGAKESATVEAVYRDNSLVGSLVVPEKLWADHTSQPLLRAVLVKVADGSTADEAHRALEPLADKLGGDVQNKDEYASAATQGLDMLLSIIYVLLALAVIIALLGIANTLSLAVHERRRELGLLRAVGQTRRQVRSVLRLESVIISVFGTIVGLGLGAFLGWTLFATVASASDTLGSHFALPVVQLVVITVLGALAGVLAARRPARRAARIPVLEAIASQ
ncbi:MAG TPA: FtsX-like permease family protein [Acidimicrobiales bacterium]|jgi:putative ABC transport system permease protein